MIDATTDMIVRCAKCSGAWTTVAESIGHEHFDVEEHPVSTYTPTAEDLARARRLLDHPNADSPSYVLGTIRSCLDAIDDGHPVDEEIRSARALLAVFNERR